MKSLIFILYMICNCRKIYLNITYCFVVSIADNHFDYEHQSIWYDTFTQCSLNRQSPIELNSQEVSLFKITTANTTCYSIFY